MDNTNKVALTLGFGALGTVLAYYGYNQINDDEEPSKESQEIDEVIKNADNNSKKTTDNGENVVKTETSDGKAVKSETEKEISQVKNQWSQYWENEYSQETNDKENIAVL